MKIKNTHSKAGMNRNFRLSGGASNWGYSDGLAPWTREIANPLFTWNPIPTEKESKKGKCLFVQGELFPEQLKDGSMKKSQPVTLLES